MITVKQKVNELLESGQISNEFLKKIHKNKVNQVPAMGSGTLGKEQIESVKFLEDNRIINVNHVKYLMERMAEDGVVNDVVIAYDNKGNQYAWDGQHKLCASYMLGYNAPFTSYYERHLHFSLEEMVKRINTKQKNWDNDDFVRSWINNGITFFEEFEKLNKEVTGVFKDALLSVVLGKKDSMQNLKKLKLETLKERVKGITYEDYKERLELALDLKKRMINMKSIQTDDRAINSGWLQFLVSQEFDKIPQVMYSFVNYLEKLELQDVVYSPIPVNDSNWKTRFKELFKKWMEGKIK